MCARGIPDLADLYVGNNYTVEANCQSGPMEGTELVLYLPGQFRQLDISEFLLMKNCNDIARLCRHELVESDCSKYQKLFLDASSHLYKRVRL